MNSHAPHPISQTISTLNKHLPKEQHAFSEALFKNASNEDMMLIEPSLLAEMSATGHQAIAKIPERTLSVTPLGEQSTLITLTISNRPFVLDSVLVELANHRPAIQLVTHPIIDDISLIMIVLGQSNAEERSNLERELHTVLEQVRAITDDWKPMIGVLEKTISDLRDTPPPLPTDKIAEAIQFIKWITENNFTLMGVRELTYEGDRETGELQPIKGTSMGMLRDESITLMTRGGKPVQTTPEIRDFLFNEDPLIITKANMRSRVHRRSHLDYIGIKRYTSDGKLAGELLAVGLFTSTAYTKSVMTIPVLRHKAHAVLEQINVDPTGHHGKAIINIIENWPRDEMFQLDVATLLEFSQSAAQLEERPRVRVMPRADKFDRFVSIIVYVLRDHYDSDTRQRIGNYLANAFDGYQSAFFPTFLNNGLTRVQFIIGRSGGKTPSVSSHELEAQITQICRTWQDRLHDVSQQASGHQYPAYYQKSFEPQIAAQDAALFESLNDENHIELDFIDHDHPERMGLKLFHLESAVPLSRRVPLLENLGFKVIEESTFKITRHDTKTVFLHNMILQSANGAALEREKSEALLQDTLQAVWQSYCDDDNFNALVLNTQIDWKQAAVFRAYARYLKQIRSRFTIESMAETLVKYSAITIHLAELFDARFNPILKNAEAQEQTKNTEILTALEAVHSSDDDRILRNFLNLINATLRTNFYSPQLQSPASETTPTPVLAFKIDPSAVNIMPQPVPYREIFVSSPRVEGLHLRYGPVARGGLRWSDRAQDYRTEVLGLVKAQQVKNAVIVPVGSKGGFLPKQLPTDGDRNAWFEEGRHAYKIFISSLLSLTDNLVEGEISPPPEIIRKDGDDPYFVVAADKGTSSFSDTANAISQERDFWLDDAFASGGSAGYDHKKMGITARGAWEAVKRHFREMDRDIQSQPFTAAGVGDMSGDVFGNGMLLSEHTRLIAAFDHRDIFIDPNPDCAISFKERSRLFEQDRSSWQDYKVDLISKGGGVFSRSAKKIDLSPEAAAAIGCSAGEHTPQSLMNAILKAPVDLMWFGGIGTYIRASHESDADAGDRGNDAIRVTAKELQCKVIGEGANLGLTHPARIEFNLLGGCCNSDAIDNSAGVNSSDVEVNIKIALAAAMKAGQLSRENRNILLESMTPTVADLVLRNNYLQTLAISLSERRGMEDFAHQKRLMQSLEQRNLLDRQVEDLPDNAALSERQKSNTPLTRAEIGVLLAYAKIVALDDIVASDVPDDAYLNDMLMDYFPPKMQDTYKGEINNHRLRREIISTVLANSMVNRGGPTFLSRIHDRTGANIDAIARAYICVRDAFRFPSINASIDALDTKISGALQLELYNIIQERVLSQTVWFIRYGDYSNGIGTEALAYRKAVDQLMPNFENIVPAFLAKRILTDAARYRDGGVPEDIALTLARLPIAALIPDIVYAAKQTNQSLDKAAEVFFTITETFRIGIVVDAARSITTRDYYDGLALDRALQSLHQARRDIVIDVLQEKGASEQWLENRHEDVARTKTQMADIIENDKATVSRLTVAANILADLARG